MHSRRTWRIGVQRAWIAGKASSWDALCRKSVNSFKCAGSQQAKPSRGQLTSRNAGGGPALGQMSFGATPGEGATYKISRGRSRRELCIGRMRAILSAAGATRQSRRRCRAGSCRCVCVCCKRMVGVFPKKCATGGTYAYVPCQSLQGRGCWLFTWWLVGARALAHVHARMRAYAHH